MVSILDQRFQDAEQRFLEVMYGTKKVRNEDKLLSVSPSTAASERVMFLVLLQIEKLAVKEIVHPPKNIFSLIIAKNYKKRHTI